MILEIDSNDINTYTQIYKYKDFIFLHFYKFSMIFLIL